MLPDLRFIFGALMVLAVTGMIGAGLFISARLFNQAKTGPLESRRNLAFTDSAEWNQFYEPGSVRRFVGFARQGDAREVNDAPPEQRSEPAAPASMADPFTPAELPKQADNVEAISPVHPAAETAADTPGAPIDVAATVALPSLPDQVRETPAAERPAVRANSLAIAKPAAAEAVAAHVSPASLPDEPAVSEPPAGAEVMRLPDVGTPDGASTGAVENKNGPAAEAADARSVATDKSGPPAINERVAATPPQSAALAKAAAPVPAARAPVKRAVADDDDEPARRRAGSQPQPRVLASRPRAAGPPWNGTQWADPRRPPSGQPVFGPHFPYATPQPGQPHFGPHFPYATPQSNRQPVARARTPQYAQPSHDPRQFAPQRSAPQRSAPRQPSYGPAYWR